MNKFLYGMLFQICIASLVQDAMGKERYLKSIEANWISGWITVPIALLGMVLIIVSMRLRTQRKAKKKEAERKLVEAFAQPGRPSPL